MSFKIDTDENTNDYQSVWLALFPPLWIEKKGVDGTLLEEWRPVSNVSCIYNCKEESLRVSFNYEVINYAPTNITKKKHAPLANASPKKASPPKSPIQCRKMPSQPKKAKDLMQEQMVGSNKKRLIGNAFLFFYSRHVCTIEKSRHFARRSRRVY